MKMPEHLESVVFGPYEERTTKVDIRCRRRYYAGLDRILDLAWSELAGWVLR